MTTTEAGRFKGFGIKQVSVDLIKAGQDANGVQARADAELAKPFVWVTTNGNDYGTDLLRQHYARYHRTAAR